MTVDAEVIARLRGIEAAARAWADAEWRLHRPRRADKPSRLTAVAKAMATGGMSLVRTDDPDQCPACGHTWPCPAGRLIAALADPDGDATNEGDAE